MIVFDFDLECFIICYGSYYTCGFTFFKEAIRPLFRVFLYNQLYQNRFES